MRMQGTDRPERGRTRRWRLAALSAVVLAVAGGAGAAPAAGQGWIEPPVGLGGPVVKLSTSVSVRIDGRVASVVVEEWFENRGGGVAEGDYLYPIPGEAVFSNFSLYQGDRELRGETMEAGRARAIYEEIVRRRRDPALIELVGHGLLRARVFPIQAGERRRITLRYTQVLERAGESVQFRYAAGSRSGRDPAGPASPGGPPGGPSVPATDFILDAPADAYAEPFSPTHALDVERRDGRLRVRPATRLAGDFAVFLPLARPGVGITLATHQPGGEDGYFMLTLSPGRVEGGATPRDITAVVDVSGSMSGAKLEQTRAALHQLLGSLGPADRFRLVSFSNRIRTSGDDWSGTSARELRAARSWVDGLRADGGTDIGGALQEALRLPSSAERLPIVLFLTDGLPTAGEQDPERIARMAESHRGRARVFAFGVGYDVNTYLLDRLGAVGRGATAYVEPGEDVERAVASLAGKITHPVLTDLEIAGAPVTLEELYPRELPDLFAGEELVVFGRYRGSGRGDVHLRGRRAGREEQFGAPASFPSADPANDYIPRLWASRRLGELTRQIRLNGPDPELVEAVRTTALRYGLLSEYTSYLVQEPVELARPGLPVPTPQAAPVADAQAASGAAAVRASKQARARREVASSADLALAEAEVAESARAAGGRVVAGRTFELRDGVWWERSTRSAGVDTVGIALYSDAYFAVLAAIPELREVVTALEPVAVRGEAVWIRFGPDGETALRGREVDALVARFRGS